MNNNISSEKEKRSRSAGSGRVMDFIAKIACLVVAFFIWSSRSNKKKQKEAKDMLAAMKIGDKVKTIGGVCGYLYEINDEENTIVLETGTAEKKSYVKFDRAAIYQTAPVKGIQSAETVKAEEKDQTYTEDSATR